MIPRHIHRDLPDDAYWIISDHPRQLTVYLATDIEPDSPLEQHFVRQATRAWRHRHYPGPLVILPITATGVAWALRKLRHPLAATGVVAGGAMVALAAVSAAGPDEHHPRPTVIGAPPVHSPAVPPPRTGNPTPPQPPATPPPTTSPPPTTGPSPSPPAVTPTPRPSTPRKPAKAHPTTGRGNSSGKPGRTPPGHVATPPGHGGTPPGKPSQPPGKPPAKPGPPTTVASSCQLVEVHVGHLVRICL